MTTLTLLTLFTTASQIYNLPPYLIDSICYVESKYDVTAVHEDDGGSNSVGICQVKLETAKWLGFTGDEKDLMGPKVNIEYAAKYLAYNMKRYGQDATKAVIAYNRGNAIDVTTTRYSERVFSEWSCRRDK